MNEARRAVLLTALSDGLRKQGSWGGETHIQKSTYFVEELFDVPLGYDFILYKHGPFSFGLRDELTGLRADGLFDLEPRPYPYGPSLIPTDLAKAKMKRFPKTLGRYKPAIDFVTEHLGSKGAVELEQLSTALLVTRENEDANTERRAHILRELKPHVPISAAREAVEKVDEILAEAEGLRAA